MGCNQDVSLDDTTNEGDTTIRKDETNVMNDEKFVGTSNDYERLSPQVIDIYFPEAYDPVKRELHYRNYEDEELMGRIVRHKIKIEEFSPTVYRGHGTYHYPTVGFGHVIRDYIGFVEKYDIEFKNGINISRGKAVEILLDDFEREMKNVRGFYKGLTFNEVVAVASLFFNVGCVEVLNSILHEKIKRGKVTKQDFTMFCHINGDENMRAKQARELEYQVYKET